MTEAPAFPLSEKVSRGRPDLQPPELHKSGNVRSYITQGPSLRGLPRARPVA